MFSQIEVCLSSGQRLIKFKLFFFKIWASQSEKYDPVKTIIIIQNKQNKKESQIKRINGQNPVSCKHNRRPAATFVIISPLFDGEKNMRPLRIVTSYTRMPKNGI